MSDDRTLHRLIAATYDASAPSREPAGLLDDVLLTTSRSRQSPRWLALIKEPPMRLTSGLAVGSPTARVALLVLASLLLVVLATSAVVAGSTLLAGSAPIIVASDGSGDHASVVDAVAAANDGDTILVRPGTYPGTVVIDKDVTLRGDGPREEIILEFTADSPVIRTEWAALPYGVLFVDSAGTISDVSVHGPTVATAFVIVGRAPTIERVTSTLEGVVGDGPHSGVGLVHGASATIRKSTFDGPIWGLGDATMPEYDGILGERLVTVEDNVVDAGIWVTTSNGGSVKRNTVDSEEVVATISVALIDDGTAEVSGNTVPGITFDGQDGTGVTVRENTIRGGDEFGVGINLGPGSPTIEGNDIGDVEVGVVVPNDATPTIRSNTIGAKLAAIAIQGTATRPVIEGNHLCGDQRGAVQVPEGSTYTLDPSNTVCPA